MDNVRCGDERLTHGPIHRLEHNPARIEDGFRWQGIVIVLATTTTAAQSSSETNTCVFIVDPEDTDSKQRLFRDTLKAAAKVARRSASALGSRLLSRRSERYLIDLFIVCMCVLWC